MIPPAPHMKSSRCQSWWWLDYIWWGDNRQSQDSPQNCGRCGTSTSPNVDALQKSRQAQRCARWSSQEDVESRNQKIKVPNKFRHTKRKAPTNECKCLIFNWWSHLGLNQGLPDYEACWFFVTAIPLCSFDFPYCRIKLNKMRNKFVSVIRRDFQWRIAFQYRSVYETYRHSFTRHAGCCQIAGCLPGTFDFGNRDSCRSETLVDNEVITINFIPASEHQPCVKQRHRAAHENQIPPWHSDGRKPDNRKESDRLKPDPPINLRAIYRSHYRQSCFCVDILYGYKYNENIRRSIMQITISLLFVRLFITLSAKPCNRYDYRAIAE